MKINEEHKTILNKYIPPLMLGVGGFLLTFLIYRQIAVAMRASSGLSPSLYLGLASLTFSLGALTAGNRNREPVSGWSMTFSLLISMIILFMAPLNYGWWRIPAAILAATPQFLIGRWFVKLYMESKLDGPVFIATDAAGGVLGLIIYSIGLKYIGANALFLLAGAALAGTIFRNSIAVALLVISLIPGLDNHLESLRYFRRSGELNNYEYTQTFKSVSENGSILGGWSPYSRVDIVSKEDNTLIYYNYIIHSGMRLSGYFGTGSRTIPVPFLGEKIASIGSGTGRNNSVLLKAEPKELICVEIDPFVVNTLRRHPELNGGIYEGDGVEVKVAECRKYLSANNGFDSIYMKFVEFATGWDQINLAGDIQSSRHLFTVEGVKDITSALNDDGILIVHGGDYTWKELIEPACNKLGLSSAAWEYETLMEVPYLTQKITQKGVIAVVSPSSSKIKDVSEWMEDSLSYKGEICPGITALGYEKLDSGMNKVPVTDNRPWHQHEYEYADTLRYLTLFSLFIGGWIIFRGKGKISKFNGLLIGAGWQVMITALTFQGRFLLSSPVISDNWIFSIFVAGNAFGALLVSKYVNGQMKKADRWMTYIHYIIPVLAGAVVFAIPKLGSVFVAGLAVVLFIGVVTGMPWPLLLRNAGFGLIRIRGMVAAEASGALIGLLVSRLILIQFGGHMLSIIVFLFYLIPCVYIGMNK